LKIFQKKIIQIHVVPAKDQFSSMHERHGHVEKRLPSSLKTCEIFKQSIPTTKPPKWLPKRKPKWLPEIQNGRHIPKMADENDPKWLPEFKMTDTFSSKF
jgi:hypothetical protein